MEFAAGVVGSLGAGECRPARDKGKSKNNPNAAHHWATTSCSLRPVGVKGMEVAAKVLGGSMVDLLSDPAAVAAAKAEFAKATKGKPYQSPLSADSKPAVF